MAENLFRSGVLVLALALVDLNPAHGAVPYAASRPDPELCGPAPTDYARQMGEALNLEYQIKTFGRCGVRGFGEPDSNAPVFIKGSADLIVLLHGFMASPPEMLPWRIPSPTGGWPGSGSDWKAKWSSRRSRRGGRAPDRSGRS